MKTLREAIKKVIIVSNKLDTERLKSYFISEGFDCAEFRQEAKPEYKDYSGSYLCLLNHKEAWKEALKHKFTLIVEEDFAAVLNFGKLPLPFDYDRQDVGISWLYACGAQAYSVSGKGHIIGHAGTMVAYIISNKAAQLLLESTESISNKPGPYVYSNWDTKVSGWLRLKGMENYLPFRNYGEHGGLSNPEHAKFLSEYFKRSIFKAFRAQGTHRADVLYGRLEFLPYYANNSRFNYYKVRLKARLRHSALTFRHVCSAENYPWLKASFVAD